MSADLAVLRAVNDIERMIATVPGIDVRWAISSACSHFGAEPGVVGLALVEKLIARDRARAALAGLDEADR